MNFLRTPDDHFENLPDYDFDPRYLHLSSGARVHYIDTEEGNETLLMLHGEPSWCFLYRHIIHGLQDTYRCIAPDMLGFGRSDKPAELDDHTFDLHYDALAEFVTTLDLTDITLVVQDWGGLLGLPFAVEHENRIKRLVIMNTGLGTGDVDMGEGFMKWQNFARRMGTEMLAGLIVRGASHSKLSREVLAAYDAPFPDASYRAGIAAMPLRVPTTPDMPGAELSRKARERYKTWQKPTLLLFSDQDPVTSAGVHFFRKLIPAVQEQPEITIEGAGHFLQEESGQEIGQHIRAFLERTP